MLSKKKLSICKKKKKKKPGKFILRGNTYVHLKCIWKQWAVKDCPLKDQGNRILDFMSMTQLLWWLVQGK